MHKELKKHLIFIEGIVDLFYPFVEGVLHDLNSGTIAAIYNNFSRRKIGEVTPLQEFKLSLDQFPDYFPPYYKTNWDGRKLKCISVTIRETKGKPIGLICFNFDVSCFEDIGDKVGSLLRLKKGGESPVEFLGKSWKEEIQSQIDQYLKENGESLHRIDKNQKKKLIAHLYKQGAFNYKNAASFIGDALGISRASLYNYMREIE